MKALIILPLLLAACHSGPSVSADNASVAEVDAKVKAAGGRAVFLTPGHWESTVTIDRVDIPGLPPGMADKMKQVAAGRTQASCLSDAEAKKPAGNFFGGDAGKDCRYEHFRMAGGALDAKMICKGRSVGEQATVVLAGTYGGDAFHLKMRTGASGGGVASDGIAMAATVDAKRTGACTGQER